MKSDEKVDIHVQNVSMKFYVMNEKVDSLKEYFLKRISKKIRYNSFFALKSLSFTIHKGERIGIIGHNGAGKSTLLKIIAGVLKPTEGKVIVQGEVAPLLELGAGFDPDLTGFENIYLNAAILGKSKNYIESRIDQIIAYAELGDFINTPIKNYSSGMRARLGFSIATHMDPDILIVDEILSVGDENFRQKSQRTMIELMNSGKTVIMVSHNMNQIEQLTDKVLWLDHGEIVEIGESSYVCKKYLQHHRGR